ncbi:MAG: hemolysin family protein [Hyphomonadaceae bacterium]|jgi:CBS domain containing-hemolysin-like protein|nr:hemolysin family protein [Hyphomonadaceae bacterium]
MSDDSSSRVEANGTRIGLFQRLTRGLRRKDATTHADPVEVLRERAESGEALGENQREMIIAAASFDRIRVGEIMVPRADIAAIEINTTLGEVARAFAEHQHSRFPIYTDVLDHPVGMVHVKDVLACLTPQEDGTVPHQPDERLLAKLKREVLFVPASLQLPNLLKQMRTKRCQMALVIDEYGGTDGLVTIEDLLEEIIGEIDDEYDDDAAEMLVALNTGRWEADARVELDMLQEQTGADFAMEDMEDEIDTIGGLVFAIAGRIPQRGELLKHPNGYEFEVVEVDARRIRKVRLRAPEHARGEPATIAAGANDS